MPKNAVEEASVGQGAEPVRAPTRLKRWYDATLVALGKAVLLFLLLNLLLYIVIRVKRPPTGADPLSRYGADQLQMAYPGWQREDVKTLLKETYRPSEYEPFTGFRDRPFRGRFVNVDPAGFRFSKNQAPWPPRTEAFNVFVFGGSTTFGVGLPDDETIASYLEECAPANHSRGPLAVYNFGRQAYFSSQELILFQQLLKAGFVPQVAVFIDGINEFLFDTGRPRFTDKFRRVMDGVPDSSPLDNVPVVKAAQWLRDRGTKPQPRNATNNADPAILEGVINRWLANKRMIEVVAGGFGVRTIFVWQPVPTYKYDLRYHVFLSNSSRLPPDQWMPRDHYGYALMESMRAQGRLGPDVLWLADMQQDKHENLYVDRVHYNARFSREIAAQVCGFLNRPPNGK